MGKKLDDDSPYWALFLIMDETKITVCGVLIDNQVIIEVAHQLFPANLQKIIQNLPDLIGGGWFSTGLIFTATPLAYNWVCFPGTSGYRWLK